MDADQVLEALRIELARRRITQRDIERRFGWGHSYLSSVLAGRTELKVRTLFKLLDTLEMSPSEFLANIEGVEPPRKKPQPERLVRAEQLESLFELLQKAGKVAESLSEKGQSLTLGRDRRGV